MKISNNWHELLVVITLVGLLIHVTLLLYLPTYSLLPIYLVLGIGIIPLSIKILKKLLKKDFGADILALSALITSVILQEYLAGALIILMLASGESLEQFAMHKASSVLEALSKRMPNSAYRQEVAEVKEILLCDIQIGDRLIIFPHATVPVDGTVLEGNGTMDESYLTGEPYQIDKAPGAVVLSGAINGESAFVIRADKLADDSRYAAIMTVMHDATQKRPTIRRIGDQIGSIFAPISFAIALAAWAITGEPDRFLSVLVVATPCPLLIAIPIALMSAISQAAKQGIVIRDPVVLERLPTCRTAIFDKTGTLTYGKPAVTAILCAPGFKKEEVLQTAASLERYSKHPLAGAILEAASSQNLFLAKANSVSEKPGEGLYGVLNGYHWTLTSRQKISHKWPNVLQDLPPIRVGLECILLCNDRYAGLFQLRDTPRLEGQSFIAHLGPSHQFNKILLLSGDRTSEVTYLAQVLGIKDTLAEQSPEQKLLLVRAETAKSPTLFMGDGINDAPALAAATVGLAFGQHSSITSEAAGAVILENTLFKVDELLHISLALRHIVLQCAIGGMVVSLIGIGIAAMGFLTPVQGAITQEFIDVCAILNALRLAWRPKVITDMPK